MHALVVDDSRAIRRIICEMLAKLGYETSQASDGIEALERIEQIPTPDIVLVDWNMPRMNGIDLIKALRAKEKFKNMPIMMVTTETEMERMAQAFIAGANEYVMKPFDQEVISQKLELLGVGV